MTARTTFFWDVSEDYGEDELEIMTDSFMCSGVRVRADGSMDLKPKLNTGSTAVVLASGDALCAGHWYHTASNVTLTPTSAHYGKKCAVFIRTNWSTKKTNPIIVAGTANAAPSLTREWGSIYDIEICTFSVGSKGTVTSLSDKRTNGEVCGGIRARGTSELDEYIEQATESFENWYNTVVAQTGWVQVYAQDSQPSNPPDGTLWIDSTKRHVKKKSGSSWATLGVINPYNIYGVRLKTDHVYDSKTTPTYTPFDVCNEGFVTNSGYARFIGEGKTAISLDGVYTINVMIRISDQANTQKFHVYLIKNDSRNGVKIGEAYCDNTGLTTKDALLNISSTVRCLKDEVIYVKIVPHGKDLYRVASQSNINIVPVKVV